VAGLTEQRAFVELREVSKRFGGVQALKGITMSIEAGTVHGLVGVNGAGKSTLGKIIGGAVSRDGGNLLIEGRPVDYRSPRDALADGIAVIQQEVTLVPDLTVAQNVLLGVETARGLGFDRADMRRRYAGLVDRAGFDLPPDIPVSALSVAEQQKVEILRALARDARLIVMDEPTSSLTGNETEQLHAVVRGLRAEGLTIIYVSHLLEEVVALADRTTVFRNGTLIETLEAADATVERLVLGMLGQEMSLTFPLRATPAPDADVVLRAEGMTRAGALQDVTLQVRRGEIVGIAGLIGSGRTEVARAIFGADPLDAGAIEVDGEPLKPGSPRRAVEAGIGLVPEDRNAQGLLMDLSQRVNMTLPHLGRLGRWLFTARGQEQAETTRLIDRLGVVPRQPERPVRLLSGGNQQKVLFGKWLLRTPKMILLDEPTRGVDVGAKRSIYDLIASLAGSGMGVLLISSELEEVLGLAHRVIVMRRGRVVRELDATEFSADAVMHAAFGIESRLVEEVPSGT
jgi:ABC-type sugar transport system ATPase subunit